MVGARTVEGLRRAYGRVRTWPGLGLVATRMVWAVKGALGRPVSVCAPVPAAPPTRRPVARPANDTRLLVALAAVQGLGERLSALERAETAVAPPPPARSARPGSVSVVVSTLDRAGWLDRALTALVYQRHPDFEVIVVAGPSRDGTDAVLARHAERVQVRRCASANLSASRNLGLLTAGGEVVAFLDDDAAPEPDWLERLVEPYADPAVGGVGGPIRDASGIAFQCRVMACDRLGRSEEVETVRRARPDPPGPGVSRFLSLTGANCSFRRDALLAVGGFDEAYSYFLDETDACLRLAEAGWRLEVAPEAEVHHAYAPNAQRREDRSPLSLVAPARSTAYFAFRNAAGRLGAAAAADHLQGYADALRRDIAWRRDAGVCDRAHAERLAAEVNAGVADGVRLALSGPRRLLALPRGAMGGGPHPSRGRAAALRPDADRLKLCLLSQDYPRREGTGLPPGGVAVWTEALAQALAGRGHEVTVVARASGGAPPSVGFEAEGGRGVWVHRIGPAAPGGRPSPLLAGVPESVAAPARAAAAEVARADARRRFDLVMGPLWDLEPAGLFGAGWPVAVSLHTACAQMLPFKPEWDARYRKGHVDRVIAAERRLLAAAPHVLANSCAAARDVGEALGLPDLAGRATVIPHGLPDLARGVAPAPRPAEGVEVLFVGRLELRKGVDVLLAAAPALLALDPGMRLAVVGEAVEPGHRERFLAAAAGAPWLERVRFEGPLPRRELLARYAAADVVVAPSRYESFGLTALEAMIFAKPCVASRVGGLAELVRDRVTGRLVPPDDPAALTSALLALARSPALRGRMGAAGRSRYEALFTAEAMADAYARWAREIVAPCRMAAE